jgi:hypothetical protein
MVWAAFILGLISSFHCVGMCGPLAMAVPVQDLTPVRKSIAIILYHSGRILTYTFLGLLFGLLGRHLFIAGYQQWISITLGIIILTVILQQKLFKQNSSSFISQKLTGTLNNWMRLIWSRHSLFSSLLFGAVNGLLPCGMVYYALVGAFSAGSLSGGVFFMMLFGIGTLPLMLSVHFLGASYLTPAFRSRMRKMVPVFVGFMGVLLILRGLNLGIPYISPFLGNEASQAINCH